MLYVYSQLESGILAKTKIDGDRAKNEKVEADVFRAESTLREDQDKLKKAANNCSGFLQNTNTYKKSL